MCRVFDVEYQNATKVENLQKRLFFCFLFHFFHRSFPLTGCVA